MNEEKSPTTEVVETPEVQPISPAQFLAGLPGAPSAAQLDSWKAQVPNNRIRLFAPDMKRVYVLRGINGMEMANIQKAVPANAEDKDREVQLIACERAILWTNATPNHKMTVQELRTAAAGLPVSLFSIIVELSDFMDPERIAMLSGDL